MQFRLIFMSMTSLLFLMLSGCGYHAVGSHSENQDYGRTVWVDFIGNTTSSSTAQTVLRRGITDELHSMRSLVPANSKETSDLLISGMIKSYSIKAVSYTAADRVREFRLTVDVELEARKNTVKIPLWKGLLSASQDFPAGNPLQPDLALQKNAEDAALEAASRKLARYLITSMEESY